MITKIDKPKVALENWYYSHSQYGGFKMPSDTECKDKHVFLHGEAHGHPRFEPGTHIYTSYIESADFARRTVETRNTLYSLGAPLPEYVEWLKENDFQFKA